MDYAVIGATFEAFGAVRQLIWALHDAKVDADAKEKISEALKRLGDTQDGMFQMREELRRLQDERDVLRQKLADVDQWTAIAAKYELAQTPGGAWVLQSTTAPLHYVCPSCFNRKEIHPLQPNRTSSGKHRCTGCTSEFPVDARTAGPSFRRVTRPR